MPSPGAVAHGRVVKRARPRQSSRPISNQLIEYVVGPQGPSARAKATNKLAEYDAEIKYYYLSRGYTLEQLHEVMEIIFRIGATIKQYGGYVDRMRLKKKLTKEEWTKVAPYFYACHEMKRDVAVRINGLYIIEPPAVKKEIARQILPSQQALLMRQHQLDVDTDKSFSFDRIEAYTPSSRSICQKIPGRILKQLPIFSTDQLLLQICHSQIKQKYGDGKELSGVANSYYFKYLRVLLFRLSNNLASAQEVMELLDKIIKFGYKPSLKALFSLSNPSVRMAVENIFPYLVFRRDEELISQIFKFHYRDHNDMATLWYKSFKYQLDLGVEFGFEDTYGFLDIIQFIVDGIIKHGFYAQTADDGALILACAVQYMIMEIDTMFIFLPPNISWAQIEEAYERLGLESVLELEDGVSLQKRLELGFRRNLHSIMLDSVLGDDIDTVRILFPYSILNTQNGMEKIRHSIYNDLNIAPVWDRLGAPAFHCIVLAADEEQQPCAWGRINYWLKDGLISVACRLNYTQLGDFLLDYFKWYGDHISIVRPVLSALDHLGHLGYKDIGPIFSWRYFRRAGKYETLAVAKSSRYVEWCEWLIRNGVGIESILDRMAQAHHWGALNEALGLYADFIGLNSKNSLLYDLISIPDQIPNHIDGNEDSAMLLVLENLLRSIAKLQIREGDILQRRTLNPIFLDALVNIDMEVLKGSWTNRWMDSVPETCEIPEPKVPEKLCSMLGECIGFHLHAPRRAIAIAAISTHLKSKGFRCCDISSQRFADDMLPLYMLRGDSDRRSSFNILQLLAILAEPDLLKVAFSSCRPDALIQLQKSYTYYFSPLHIAVAEGSLECFRIFIENGADPRESLSLGIHRRNLLYVAIEEGHMDIARCLIEYGAFPPSGCKHNQSQNGPKSGRAAYEEQNINATILDSEPMPEVQLAVQLGRLDFLSLLLHAHIDARYEALDEAKRCRNKTMIDWINEYWMDGRQPTQQPVLSTDALSYLPEDYDI